MNVKKAVRSSFERYGRVIAKSDDDALIKLRALVEAELTKRGLLLNVGETGEKLCIEYFKSKAGLPKLLQSPPGAKNVDALSRDGDRYSIKTFMKAKKTGTIYPDKDERKQLFEYLLIVGLHTNYELKAIYRYSWEQFLSVRAWDKRMNAWYVPLSKKKLKFAEIVLEESPPD